METPPKDINLKMGWQTLDTAPRDGSYVLLHGEPYDSGDTEVYVGMWDSAANSFTFWFACCSYAPKCEATHWMPLPKPPEAQ